MPFFEQVSFPLGITNKMSKKCSIELIFLGSSGAIQVPAFFCSCKVCQAARNDPKQHRTRASIALVGHETVLIDASPELDFQLERQAINKIDRIFITHWHHDHVWGLGSLGLISGLCKWPPIEVYLSRQMLYHFDQELAYMKNKVKLHPLHPGDKFKLPDVTWEVVKTTHTEDSVGFIVQSSKRFAYLVDGVVPPPQTMDRLRGLDFLILESTVDKLVLQGGEEAVNFSLREAVDFWKRTGIKECILTHLSCHGLIKGKIVSGLSNSERLEYEAKNPGLKFAYDGMRIKL